eukprot:TRINITY_DN2160_c0_g1_i1.p2 TRINITY_DN2160_c0_g1~~TRINITY_DN2160_c0_g1_i1.p2  ORF type:complete len:132 (+),score=3.94 TRINITY_DN2160_c0_g1_i1:675-1070(+)
MGWISIQVTHGQTTCSTYTKVNGSGANGASTTSTSKQQYSKFGKLLNRKVSSSLQCFPGLIVYWRIQINCSDPTRNSLISNQNGQQKVKEYNRCKELFHVQQQIQVQTVVYYLFYQDCQNTSTARFGFCLI